MYLVDTNVLSEARRGRPEARDWLRSVEPDRVFLSVVTLGEIMRVAALKALTDPAAGAVLLQWLNRTHTDHARRILAVTDEIAIEWGRLAALRPRAMADGLIAATALIQTMTLVTRNVADFDDLPLAIINPWALV
jgi:predicted nucleic acid-binding protein